LLPLFAVALCRRCGCSEVILYSQEDVVQRVMQLTQGRGVKVSTQQVLPAPTLLDMHVLHMN
jgi:NADPH:quinone reductase-like Zn-dependent oxidoreductase